MVSQINPKPNTFYKEKVLDDDVGVIPVYGDAYIGLTSTYDLASSPNSTYYLGESTVITENDYVYGNGTLSECYLKMYINKLSRVHPQTAPWVDIYGLKSNIDLIEGDLAIDTTVGDISIYSSVYDMETPWIVEDFDGTNKFFADVPSRYQPGFVRVQSDFLTISSQDYVNAVWSTHEGATDNHSGYSWANVGEEISHAVDWGVSQALEAGNWYIQGLQSLWNILRLDDDRPGQIPAFDLNNVAFMAAERLTLRKHSDGLYYYMAPGSQQLVELSRNAKATLLNSLSEGHNRQWWVARGATATASNYGIDNAGTQYNQFDETFVAHCDQYNSIFSEVFRRGMARDVKSETTGGSGDDEKFLAYVNADLVTDDVASDGNAFEMKLFWENYSGSLDGSSDISIIDGANFFGYGSIDQGSASSDISGSRHPLTQDIFGSITDIPPPTMYDITQANLSGSIAPEIEIIFKINQMPTLPYSVSTSTALVYADRGREISRSFNVLFDYLAIKAPVANSGSWSEDPRITENIADWYGSTLNVNGGGPLILNFSKTVQGNEINVCAYWNSDSTDGNIKLYNSEGNTGYFGAVYKAPPGSARATTLGYDAYQTTIPEGEWVKMRIKFGNKQLASGSIVTDTTPYSDRGADVIAYFPELKDFNGAMKKIQVWSPVQMDLINGFFPNTLTLWANNMRSINEVLGANNVTYANNGYTQKDDVPNDDKIVDVLVDRISFHGWGSLTNNASVTRENGMGNLLKIPNAKGIPVADPNTKVTQVTNASGSDNYFGGYTHPIANYLSIGYDSSGTAHAGVQKHSLLFNDFFTPSPAVVNQIPYIKAGYYTAANYGEKQSNWWDNLTVGGDVTDNIRVGGLAGYTDGFSQKGLIGVSSSFTSWVQSGNPYVGAKILTISDDGTQITVDKPEIFNTDTDERFVVELVGAASTSGGTPPGDDYSRGYTYADYLVGSGSKGYAAPLTQSKARAGNVIYLSDSILYDDQDFRLGQGDAGIVSIAEWNSNCRLRISPYKFWVNLAVVNASNAQAGAEGFAATVSNITVGAGYAVDPGYGSYDFTMSGGTGTGLVINAYVTKRWEGDSVSPRTVNYIVSGGTGYVVDDVVEFPSTTATISASCVIQSINAGWGSWYTDISGGAATPLAPRSYNTVVPVSGGSTFGTTFNETLYNDGLYSNVWDLDFTAAQSNYVINNVDYSFGIIEKDTADEPSTVSLETGGGKGYIMRDFLLSGNNYINLTNYIRVNKPKFGDDFNFMVVPTYMMTQGTAYTINVDTDDGTVVPKLVYGIKDMPPVISDFTASPSIDFLKDGADIYNITKAGATDIKFEWQEEKDIWHRILWVDTAPIVTKYHTANFIAPLNEAGATAYYYLSAGNLADDTKVALTGTNTPNIEGAMGYGSYATGATSISSSAGDLALGSADEFTFMATLKPNDPGASSGVFFFTSGNSNEIAFQAYITPSQQVGVDFNEEAIALLSATTYDCDGVQPLAIVLTYDRTLANNNAKLYVNGKLEDTADYTTVFSGTTSQTVWIASATGGTMPYSGFVEEITFHSKAAYVPTTPSSFLLPTRQLADLSAGNSKFYNGRLFAFDYHNIRGMGRTDVGRSTQVGWKVTGI